MSNFKIKKKKKSKLEFRDSTTLDKRHKEKSLQFKEEKILLPTKIDKVEELEYKLELLNSKKEFFSDEDLEERANILNQLDILKEEIELTKNN